MIPIELRYAIWIAHSKKDFYRGGLIENFDGLEIDHIIPKSTDVETLNKKIEKYNLDKDFTLNSIENLLPTSKFHNRQKAGNAYSESNERHFLEMSAKKKDKVIEEWNKTIRNRKLKEKIQFIKSYNIVDSDQYWVKPSYFNSDTFVALNGYLPSKFDVSGNCAIEFYEMGTMILLNHDALTKLINHKTSTLEEQLLQYYNSENKIAFLIVESSALHIKKEAYDQFLNILSDFLNVYEKFSSRYELFMGTKAFERVGPGYKLMEILPEEWDYLLKYAYSKDIDNEESFELRFNSNPNSLIALNENGENIVFFVTPVYDTNKVGLLWHPPEIRDREFINEGKVWTAEQTAKWVEKNLSDRMSNQQTGLVQTNRANTLEKFLRLIFHCNKY